MQYGRSDSHLRSSNQRAFNTVSGEVSADSKAFCQALCAGHPVDDGRPIAGVGRIDRHRDARTRHIGRVTSAVAGGHIIEEDIYTVSMTFDGRLLGATATFSSIEHILIGTAFLSDYFLEISFPRKLVQLERESGDVLSGNGTESA